MSECRQNPMYAGPKQCSNGTVGYTSDHNIDPWKHRSSGMKCSTCMWFAPKVVKHEDGGETVSLGRCRRHAPMMSGYPVVYLTDWCGDHKLNEETAHG